MHKSRSCLKKGRRNFRYPRGRRGKTLIISKGVPGRWLRGGRTAQKEILYYEKKVFTDAVPAKKSEHEGTGKKIKTTTYEEERGAQPSQRKKTGRR